MPRMKANKTKPLQQDEVTLLKEQVAVLEVQLDWFKRQLFGRKSEKQLIDDIQQGSCLKQPKLTYHQMKPLISNPTNANQILNAMAMKLMTLVCGLMTLFPQR